MYHHRLEECATQFSGGKNWLDTHHAKIVEMPGIEPGAFRMRSGRSTTEPHPLVDLADHQVEGYRVHSNRELTSFVFIP